MAERFLLAERIYTQLFESWIHELYCSTLKDRTISLRVRKIGAGLSIWSKSIKGIKTPEQFFNAYMNIHEEIGIDNCSFENEGLLKLFEHLPIFALATAKYFEIEYEDDEIDKEFFLFSFPLYLGLKINFSNDFKQAYILFSEIYNFTKQYFNIHFDLPIGIHNVNDNSILFPNKKYHRYRHELRKFKHTQIVREHLNKCVWEKNIHIKNFAKFSADERRYNLIRKFIDEYLKKENRLPIGEFNIDNSRVIFHKS